MNKTSRLMDEKSNILIKGCPEDFVVMEKMPSSRVKEFKSTKFGKFSIFTLKKRGVDMISAIRALSKVYNIRERGFSYAGTKDKNAITVQYCSALGKIYDKRISFGSSGDFIEVKRIGYSQRPISLGDHAGNEFVIKVRNATQDPKCLLSKFILHNENKEGEENNYSLRKGDTILIPNYFGSQRFGLMRNNHLIGKLIVLSRFGEAVDLVKWQMKEKISPKLLSLSGIEFLKALNPKQAMMYVHSYQSFIFNKAISSYIKENYDSFELKYKFGWLVFPKKEEIKRLAKKRYLKVSLAGFGFEREGLIDRYIFKEMEKEHIKDRDFIIRQIPALSAESHKRDFLIRLKQFSIKEEEEEEEEEKVKKEGRAKNQEDDYKENKNEGCIKIDDDIKFLGYKKNNRINEKKRVYEVKFTLGKGSYATIVIAGLFNQRPIAP